MFSAYVENDFGTSKKEVKMAGKTVSDKIRAMAAKKSKEEAARKKAEIDEKSEIDLAVINTILDLVNNGLVYKDFSEDRYRHDYRVVTEDTVFDDYTSKSYNGQTSVRRVQAAYGDIAHTEILVNGHRYYHAKDVFERYENDLKRLAENHNEQRAIEEKKRYMLEDLRKFEPLLKKLMQDYELSIEDKEDE